MKLYIAGIHPKHYFQLVSRLEYKYLLFNYNDLKNTAGVIPAMIAYKRTHPEVRYILDSGAHALQKETNTVNYDEFFFGYMRFLMDYGFLFDQYVELDIENVVGMEKVTKWTNLLKQTFSTPPIEVWHKWRGEDAKAGDEIWKDMTERLDYVGLSGFLIKAGGAAELPPRRMKEYLRIAKKNDCKVHGLGLTSPKILVTHDFYSVDSTTWLSSGQFGRNFHFDGNILREIHPGDDLWPMMTKMDLYQRLSYNIFQWKQFADLLESGSE